MIIDLTLKKDLKANETFQQATDYVPDDRVKQRTAQVNKDFAWAYLLRQKPYEEWNGVSLTDKMNMSQRSYNQWVDSASNDPAQSWRSQAFRPIVRNKIITIAAHLTAAIIYPNVYAQNEKDEEDQNAGIVMRSLIEWVEEKYDYDKNFLFAVLSALINPACFIHQEYAEHFREIKELQADKTWKVKKILDEAFSGFRATIIPCDELFIADFYTFEMQQQPYLIWRRVIDYATAKAKYGDLPLFSAVKPGLQYLFYDTNNLFYQVYDQTLRGRLVEEVIYYNRSADLELRFLNGVLMDDPDRPNPRKDKNYPFVKTGFEPIDLGRFFYYKSLADKLGPDETVVNTAYRMTIDGTYMQIMKPTVVVGDQMVSSNIMIPGSTSTMNLKPGEKLQDMFQTIDTNVNLAAGFNILSKVEGSMAESSTDPFAGGQAPSGRATAYQISRQEENSKVMLGLFAKMIGFMVKDLGYLMINDILQFMTVAQVDEIESPDGALRFRSFILPDKTIDGQKKSQHIKFDGELPDEVTAEQNMKISKAIAKEQLKQGGKVEIYRVNPTIFRELQYRIVVRPEALSPQSDALKKALALEEYQLAMANPLIEKKAITQDLLLASYDATKDDTEKYMMKQQPQAPGQPGAPQGQPGSGGGSGGFNPFGQSPNPLAGQNTQQVAIPQS